MNFSRFITSPSAERPLSSVEASLCCGKVCQKGKESAHPFHLPPRAFSFFFRFNYCYFYRNTQREPLRRREAAGSETGRRDLFREFATREDGWNSANQSNSSDSKRTCWNVFVQHGRKVLRIGWKLDEILKHCKSIWTRNLFSQLKLYKSCINTDFCKHQRIHYCKGATGHLH